MKASELLVRCLENEGVRYIFGVPGEENLEFMEALSHSAQITFVTTRHEQGAAFMANVSGYELVEWAPQVWNSKNDKTIVHIDSTAAEVDGHYLPAIEVVGEIGESLRALEAGCDFHVPQWMDSRYRRDALRILERHRTDASFP